MRDIRDIAFIEVAILILVESFLQSVLNISVNEMQEKVAILILVESFLQ